MTAEPSADELVRQGLEESRADRADVAMALFGRAAALRPHWGVPHFLMGAELAEAGRLDEAEASYAQAVILAPDLQMARFQLGLLQFTRGRTAVALLTWRPLLDRPDEEPLPRIVSGFAALAAGDAAAAVTLFEQSIAANGEHPALNADLRRLIMRIRGRAGEGADASAPAAAAGGESPAESAQHFLVSRYRDRLH